MAHVIGLKVETIDAKRRDAIMEAIAEIIADFSGADEATITYSREITTPHGKRKITDTITIEPGEAIDFDAINESMSLTTTRPLELLWSKTNTA